MAEVIKKGQKTIFRVAIQTKIWRQNSEFSGARIWKPIKSQKIVFHSKLQYDPCKENQENVRKKAAHFWPEL